MSGSTIGQLTVVLASPILSRIYEPKFFGFFSTYAAFVYLANSLSSLRLDFSILSADKEDEKGILYFSSVILFIFTIITTIAVVGVSFTSFYQDYFYAIPFGILTGGLFNILNNYLLKKNFYEKMAIYKTLQSLLGVIFQVILGLIGFHLIGLVAGQIMGLLLAIFGMSIIVYKTIKKNDSIKPWHYYSNKYKNFIIHDSIGSFFSVASNHTPVILFSTLLGYYFGGLYYMAYRVLIFPLSVVSNSFSQYISSKYFLWSSSGDFEKILGDILITMFLISFIPICSFLIYSELAFKLIFGSAWIDSGIIAGLCVGWMALKFIYDIGQNSFVLTGNQKFNMSFQVFIFAIRFLSIVIPFLFFGLKGIETIKVFCIASFSAYLLGLLMMLSKIKNQKSDIYLILLSVLIFISVFLINQFNLDMKEKIALVFVLFFAWSAIIYQKKSDLLILFNTIKSGDEK